MYRLERGKSTVETRKQICVDKILRQLLKPLNNLK